MTTISRNVRAAVLALLAVQLCATARAAAPLVVLIDPLSERALPGETPKSIIARWPPKSRNAAAVMLEKHGDPEQFDRATMVWFNKDTWKRTVVHRRLVNRDPAGKRADFLEQTVGYLAPGDAAATLKRFNPLIETSPTAGELTFASSSESKNRLAMNLADEIITRKRAVADARTAMLKISRLEASGKSSPYLTTLLFDYDNSRVMVPTGADR